MFWFGSTGLTSEEAMGDEDGVDGVRGLRYENKMTDLLNYLGLFAGEDSQTNEVVVFLSRNNVSDFIGCLLVRKFRLFFTGVLLLTFSKSEFLVITINSDFEKVKFHFQPRA